ncbi:MAG: helix-turn-helix domain-containing protein [Chitinophagales bacterium]
MNYQELGLFIKQERKKLHLTQKELADLAEVSYRILQHVEAGRKASEKNQAIILIYNPK